MNGGLGSWLFSPQPGCDACGARPALRRLSALLVLDRGLLAAFAFPAAVPLMGAGLYYRLARDDDGGEPGGTPDANSVAAGKYGGGI